MPATLAPKSGARGLAAKVFGLLDIAASLIAAAVGIWLPGALAVRGAAYLRMRRRRRRRAGPARDGEAL